MNVFIPGRWPHMDDAPVWIATRSYPILIYSIIMHVSISFGNFELFLSVLYSSRHLALFQPCVCSGNMAATAPPTGCGTFCLFRKYWCLTACCQALNSAIMQPQRTWKPLGYRMSPLWRSVHSLGGPKENRVETDNSHLKNDHGNHYARFSKCAKPCEVSKGKPRQYVREDRFYNLWTRGKPFVLFFLSIRCSALSLRG